MIIQPEIKIAPGHGNVSGLTVIESITPTGDISFFPVQSYGKYDLGQAKIRLDGRPYFAGRAIVQFLSQVMTIAQFNYLKITYCGGGYSGLVTVRFRPNTPNTYSNYNATLVLPKESELSYQMGYFRDVVWSFINLQEI